MKTTEKIVDEIVVLKCEGELMGVADWTALPEIFYNLVEEKQTKVVMDFTKVTNINSSGFGVIIGGVTTMRNNGGDIKFIGVHCGSSFQSLLLITKLSKLLEVFKTLDEAVNSFK